MANQHTSDWTPEKETLLVDLREKDDMDWPDINDTLGFPRDSSAPRSKYRRIKDAGVANVASSTGPEELDPLEVHIDALTSHKYVYEPDLGVYRFSINNELISVPEETWETIVRLYSEDGADLTQHQIAMRAGISRKKLEQMLRAYGHFKARPPVTREALERGDDMETLVGQAVEVKERRFLERLRTKSYEELKRENQRLKQDLFDRGEAKEELRAFVREELREIGGYAPRVEKHLTNAADLFDVHVTLFDPHVGLATFSEMGWTNDYNSDIALEYIREQGRQTAARIRSREGVCRTAYASFGGDFFHAPKGQTESGRPLQRDKPDRLLFRAGYEAAIDYIESIRREAQRVVVKGIGGNHGHLIDELLIDFLAMYYRDAEDVDVDDSMNTRAWFRVGNVLHVIDHGTTFSTVTSERSLSRADRIARIIAGKHYHGVTRVIFYVGHMHHREGKSQAHMEILRVPVFCHESDYEDHLGFYNDPMADVYFLDMDGRISGTERLYLVDSMPFESKLSA